VLSRIFGPKRDEVTGECNKLYNEEINDLHSSPNIVWVIKSRRMRWAGQVARKEETRGANWVWWEHLMEKEYLEDRDVDGMIILKFIFI
jgi:hypothetical protein